MKYIIGLGNPGLEYRSTKHNVGFAVVKELAKEYGIKIKEKRYSSLVGRGRIEAHAAVLIMPETYMNRSGEAVSDLVRDAAVPLDDIIVICDDINLKLGRIRLKKQGSAGGHKGLESIISALGTGDFARMRIGIATDIHKGDITRYVLTPFKKRLHKNVSHVISMACDALVSWMEKGMDEAMNRFNTKKIATS